MDRTDGETPAAALAASSATQRKWASFVLLGPLLPSMFGIFIIIIGEAVVHADVIAENADVSCGYPLDSFVRGAIVNSYLLVAVFAWSFLGFETHFSIRGRRRRLLRPFTSLAFVAFLYFLLFVCSLIIWIIGTWAVLEDFPGRACMSTVPLLYTLAVGLIITYWIGVVFGMVSIVGKLFGGQLKDSARSTLDKTKKYQADWDKAQILEAEQHLVGRKFDAYDEEGAGSIETHQAEALIGQLGMGLSGKKLRKAMAKLDPAGDGVVAKDDFVAWYAETAQDG